MNHRNAVMLFPEHPSNNVHFRNLWASIHSFMLKPVKDSIAELFPLLKLSTFFPSFQFTLVRPLLWSRKCSLLWESLIPFAKPCGQSQHLSTLTDLFKDFQAASKAWHPSKSWVNSSTVYLFTTISFITASIIFPSLNWSALFLSLPVPSWNRHPLYIY